jgi:Tol biopolymer transport system component
VHYATGQASSASIVVCRPDGSQKRVIARGSVSQPAWSPRGDRIAFGGMRLVVVRPDGGDRRTLTRSFASSAVFSPDGRDVAAVTGGRLDVFRLRGHAPPVPVADGVSPDVAPIWSPEGRRLLFVDVRGGIRLTRTVGVSRLIAEVHGSVVAVSASWRRREVVFGYQRPPDDQARLFSVEEDGSDLHALRWTGSQPSVARDGRIAVSKDCCIWTIDPARGTEHQLTRAAVLGYGEQSPSWSARRRSDRVLEQ